MKRAKTSRRARPSVPLNQMELFSDALAPVKPAPTRAPAPRKPASATQTLATKRQPPPKAPAPPLPAAPATGVLLDVRQAAARLGLSKSTLDKMRSRGVGPKFIKSTDRAVRYDPVDLDAWVTDRRRQATDKSP
jgi:predicted DNA-binding transcriptional regulator AlpA